MKRVGSQETWDAADDQAAVDAGKGKSTVKVKVTDIDTGQPASGVTLNQPEVNANGSRNPEYLKASIGNPNLTTDSNGEVTFGISAGNMVETATIKIVASHATEETATLDQVWNELEGSEEAWMYDELFSYGESSPITYIAQYTDDVNTPMTGHSMIFETTGLIGEKWERTKGEDSDGDGSPDGDFVAAEYYDEALDWPLSGGSGTSTYRDLVQYSGVTESPAGTYNTTQTVYETLDGIFFVNEVEFDIVDMDVIDN